MAASSAVFVLSNGLRVFLVQPAAIQFIKPSGFNARSEHVSKPLSVRLDRPETAIKTDELHGCSLFQSARKRVALTIEDREYISWPG